MPRLIKSPNSGSNIVNAVTPEQGGHGEVTARDALEAMDLVSRDSIGKFGRPIPLDENGYIDQKYLQDLYASMETISGDGSIEVNQTKEYFLTGYDAFSNYDVRAVSGMVSRDRNVITYTAPGAPGQGGFTINGRMVALTVTAANTVEGIAPPVILTPVRGTSGLVGPVSVTSAPFVTDNGETHASTSWQCAEDPGFTTIVASVDQSVTNKTSWSIGTVALGKHYFIRAKYHGSAGSVSPWSEETHFTSPVPTPADRPNITSPVNGATRLPSRVTLTSSPYSTVTGDPHVSSSWQISENSLFTNIAFELTNSTVNKTSWQVSGLQPAKEYYARVRYRGQLHEYTEWSPASSFRTRLAFLPETEIGKSGSYNGVTADMDDTGDRWIVGNGSPDITGVNCAAYIYRREGGLPVLEDTVQAVAGEKTLTSTIPSGGQLTVTVAGRYNSTKSYTQAEEIIIPAGAQSLTLVGKGSSANEVTAFLVGSGSVQIPAGTTSLKLIGKGSDGTTVYNPGQPYIAPTPGSPETASFSAPLSPNFNTATYPYAIEGPATGTGYKDTNGEWVFTGTAPSETYPVDGHGNPIYGNRMALEYFGITPSGLGEFIITARYRGGLTYTGSITLDSMVIVPGTPGTTGQPYIAPSTTTTDGIAATMTIQGQTYTYPGGIGGPATPRTDNITLNGTAQTLTYSIPTGGSGQYGYPGSTGISQSLAGTGEYIFPLGTSKVTITAKGGDGTTVNYPEQQYVAAKLGSGSGSGTHQYGDVIMFSVQYDSTTQTVVSTSFIAGGFTYQGHYYYEDTVTGYVNHTSGVNLAGSATAEFISHTTSNRLIATASLTGFVDSNNTPEIPYRAAYSVTTTGTPSTFTIQGITKTFPGGNGGPATATTQEITLDGSDLTMNYSIPATGSGVVQYSVSTIYSNSFTGNGSHNVPADVTSISITGRGQDGSPGDSGSKSIRTYTDVWEKKYSYGPGPSTKYVKSKSSQYETLPPINLTDGTTANFATITETSTEVRTRYIRYSDGYYVDFVSAKYGDGVPELLVKRAIDPWQASASYYNSDRRWCQMTWTSGPNDGQALNGYVRFTITSHNAPFKISDADNMNKPPITLQLNWVMRDYSEVLIAQGTATYSPTINGYSFAVTDTIGVIGIDAPVIYGVSSEGYGVNFIFNPESGNGMADMRFSISYHINPLIDSTRQPKIGTSTTVTFNGQTYTYPGGVGGPATSRNDTVTVTAGAVKPLNYTVPQGGVVSVSYTTSDTPARETTAVINGQTYTFPGSNTGAASNTTFNIDLVANYNFANGVAINQDGTLAAICSSPRAANVPGYVLILQRSGTTWTIVGELKRDDGLVWNAQSVSMDKTGNYVLVGADAQPSGSTKIGSFALYRRLAGKYAVEQIVIAPDPGVAYEAGSSVSLSGNAMIAVIGAPAGGTASRVLVYERDGNNTLVLKATLSKTTDPHSSDALGTRVYISADGSTIAASSPTSRGVNTSHANCGEVLIFRKIDNVWTQVSTVRHPTPASGLYFGQDIHLSDDGFTLSVGVPGGTGGLGEVMFFDIEGSNTVYKSNVVSSAVTGGSNFGKAIALPGHSGDLVGASKFGTYVFD